MCAYIVKFVEFKGCEEAPKLLQATVSILHMTMTYTHDVSTISYFVAA